MASFVHCRCNLHLSRSAQTSLATRINFTAEWNCSHQSTRRASTASPCEFINYQLGPIQSEGQRIQSHTSLKLKDRTLTSQQIQTTTFCFQLSVHQFIHRGNWVIPGSFLLNHIYSHLCSVKDETSLFLLMRNVLSWQHILGQEAILIYLGRSGR